VTGFVKSMTSRDHARPIFEMLPPQRKALREEGLLGSSKRSVVVSLPTSSGKTFISEFRILQALNQFDDDRGWVAYLAPTRALVNQLTSRLRKDFSHLDFGVEKVSPALEVDGMEADMLTESKEERQFRILITTPEKLDLMLRGGWEEKIGRPLTLVVVDEAHGLATSGRGIKLELLLATINRECQYAQFLLLTPFIENGERIAQWLAPDSNQSIEMGVDWTPNDRVVAISRITNGETRGSSVINLHTFHTNRQTLAIPEQLKLGEGRPLEMTFSIAKGSLGNIAAATAELMKERGTVIVLADTLPSTWKIAETFKVQSHRGYRENEDLKHIQRFLADEMGESFPLSELLEYGVGVHNGGMSEDTRALVEWLTENGHLDVLVATTTIAQGVNFPVSGVVFASHQYRSSQYPFREDMPPEDFWNIAGRAGRVDQGDLGIVALAAKDDAKQEELEDYIQKSVGELNSTLIDMAKAAVDSGNLLSLEKLSYQPGWSAFVQYLAHTYRQIGDHEQFAAQVEQVLRGTLGFQELRKTHRGWADQLVLGVHSYSERIKGKPLKLVDSTGFSWESVSNTLMRLSEERLNHVEWSPDLFTSRREDLRRMMGVLLQVPELRENLEAVTGGTSNDGDKLSNIVCSWVHGQPLTEMANDYFLKSGETDTTKAMTDCCRKVFGKLTQTASWGLSALQSMTLGDSLENMSDDDQRVLRNLPSRVYYGVNSDEAIALRLLGVPRSAAEPLAKSLQIDSKTPLHQTRQNLRGANVEAWRKALGQKGESYHRVWSILEG
jgi:replicative superfamily II helicase